MKRVEDALNRYKTLTDRKANRTKAVALIFEKLKGGRELTYRGMVYLNNKDTYFEFKDLFSLEEVRTALEKDLVAIDVELATLKPILDMTDLCLFNLELKE